MKTNFTYVSAIGLHIIIGILVYFNESLAKLYFFGILVYFGYRIVVTPKKVKTFEILKAAAYIVGVEMLLRMTKGGISYEVGKYLTIVFMMVGMFYKGISGKAYPYYMYLLFLVPPIFVASTTLSYDVNFRTNVAFVLSGPVCLGIAALFCYGKPITKNQLSKVLLQMLLPIISLTTYIFFYNPTVRDVLKNNASNSATSGGFGANQVATILGLGMFLIAVRFFTKSPTLKLKLLNLVLFVLISFRAIVTFSRGGVITAVLCILAFLLFYYLNVSRRKRNELALLTFLFGFGLVTTWVISSSETDGFIDKRYANEDHLGREKEDVATGRGELFMNELEGYIKHPFLGIGLSRAKDERLEIDGQGTTSHSEISRTLAEHGMLGVAILLILLFNPMIFRSQNKRNYYFYAFLCFWFATINHSSMRLAAPAFIYALALLNVIDDKRPLHRKQFKPANL